MFLEKNVSIGSSILHHISQETWRRGTVNFFIESIPFSFSFSIPFPQRDVHLFSHKKE